MQIAEFVDKGLRNIKNLALGMLQPDTRLYLVIENAVEQFACPLK